MSADKSPHLWGVMAKVEASYGAGATVAVGDDGWLVVEEPLPDIGWGYAGERGKAAGSGANLKRAAKNGETCTVDLVGEFIGPGDAYAADNFAQGIHAALQMAGHSATVDVTGGSEKFTYAPITALGDWTSLGLELYVDGEKYILKGAYSDLTIAAEDGGVPIWTFPTQALVTLPTDAAVPVITSYPSLVPPTAVNITLNLGTFASAIVRSFEFRKQQGFSPRTNQNTALGHSGFTPGRRNAQLDVLVEKTALVADPYHTSAGLDARQLEKAATAIALDLVVGSEQFQRFKIDADQAQLIDVGDERDGDAALWALTFDLLPSAPHLNDDYVILTD